VPEPIAVACVSGEREQAPRQDETGDERTVLDQHETSDRPYQDTGFLACLSYGEKETVVTASV
jgi:hypothetical protein